MYLWLVLATFLAMIAGYYLPLRHDTHDVINVPVAQASLIQMIAQHKIAKKWIIGESYPLTCYCAPDSCSQTSSVGKFCGRTSDAAHSTTCTCNGSLMSAEEKGKFPFNSGTTLTEDLIMPYAPLGFIYNGNYETYLFCSTNQESYSSGGVGSCDTNIPSGESVMNRFRLLITVGPIPEKWREYDNSGNFTPSIDFMNAMRTEFFSSDKAGYVVNTNSTKIINHQNGVFDIPSGGPQEKVTNCLDTYDGTCLVEMSVM